MEIQEYLQKVTGQIRNKRAGELVTAELRSHIEEQAAAYQTEGLTKEEAFSKAVEEMGDPVQTGMELDRVHRPHFPTGMVLMILFFTLVGMITQFILLRDAGGGFPADLSLGYFSRRYILFLVAGILCMLGICVLDYTIVGKYGKPLAGAFLILLFVIWRCSYLTVNGASRWIRMGAAAVDGSMLLFLYLPLFGGVLYAYRGQGGKCIVRIMVWMLLPVLLALRMPALSVALLLLLVQMGMFVLAVKNGWYRVHVQKILFATILVPCAAAGICILRAGSLAGYQKDRLSAWLAGEGHAGYLMQTIHAVMGKCSLIGLSQRALQVLKDLPDQNQDYVLVSMAARFGIIPVVMVVMLMGLLCWWMLRSVRHQRNCLGMMVGTGSVTAIAMQLMLNISMLMGWVPMTTASVPFLSYTGTGTLVTYMMLGFILSIYRNKDIVRDPKPWMIRKTETA